MIDVMDYGGGNTGSLMRCLARLGADHRLVEFGETLSASPNPVVLPGVGSFGSVMAALEARGLDRALVEAVEAGRPFLGICVGLQVLFEGSEEAPGRPGLGILPGTVVRYTEGKVPQIGWNRVAPRQEGGWKAGYAYFVNSYYAAPARPGDVLYESDYYGAFAAAVRRDNVTACQFHPEKSGAFGHDLVRRWTHAL